MALSKKLRNCRYSDDVWCAILYYVIDKQSISRLALVNDQLARLAQPALFLSIKLDSEERANGLVTLIRANSKLCLRTSSLQISSGYGHKSPSGSNPDILPWLCSPIGGWTLRHLSALTELVLNQNTPGSIEALDGVRAIALQATGKFTSLVVMNCRFAPVSGAAVMGALLDMLPDLTSFDAINNHFIESSYSVALDARLSEISHDFAQKKKTEPSLQNVNIRKPRNSFRNNLGAPSISYVAAWLLSAPRLPHLRMVSVTISTFDHINAVLEVLHKLTRPLRLLKLHAVTTISTLTLITPETQRSMRPKSSPHACADIIHVQDNTHEWKSTSAISTWIVCFLRTILSDPQTIPGPQLTLEIPVILLDPVETPHQSWNEMDIIARRTTQVSLATYISVQSKVHKSATDELAMQMLLPSCSVQGKVRIVPPSWRHLQG